MKFKDFFLSQHILINKFICSNYAKKFYSQNANKNICELGYDIVSGINKQEVVSVPKITAKKGFFEKLFHIFD